MTLFAIWPIIYIFFNKDFPVLGQNIGLGSLTILIPVAIALFTLNPEFQELDNKVLLDHVVGAKRILASAVLIFFPLLFWAGSDLFLRIIELGMWVVGLYLLYMTLTRSYGWMKGNKFPMRFTYLRGLTDKKDVEEAWSAVWHSDIVNAENENEFFSIFAEQVNKLL
jgi:hypothetical protein